MYTRGQIVGRAWALCLRKNSSHSKKKKKSVVEQQETSVLEVKSSNECFHYYMCIRQCWCISGSTILTIAHKGAIVTAKPNVLLKYCDFQHTVEHPVTTVCICKGNMYARMYIRTHVCMLMYMYVCTHTCIEVHTYNVCIYTCIWLYLVGYIRNYPTNILKLIFNFCFSCIAVHEWLHKGDYLLADITRILLWLVKA